MDKIERLALEADYVEVIGADNEGLFGDPRDLEQDENMADWMAGLREGGGEG